MNTNPNTTPCTAGNSKPAKQVSLVDTPPIKRVAELSANTQAAVEAMQKPFSKGSAAKGK